MDDRIEVIIFTIIWAVICILFVWGYVAAKTGLGIPEIKPKIRVKKKFKY